MTYEMKDFQEDEKTLRKQAKDGEISEEEFFLALKKLHNRATEGDSHLVQLARSIGISEDELFSGEYGDNYDDILTNILQKAGITESIHVPHTGDSDCTNPNCVGARAEDIIFNNFHVPREGGIQCDHCDKHFEEEPEPVFSSAQMLNQPIVHDLLYHAKTHGKESKANESEYPYLLSWDEVLIGEKEKQYNLYGKPDEEGNYSQDQKMRAFAELTAFHSSMVNQYDGMLDVNLFDQDNMCSFIAKFKSRGGAWDSGGAQNYKDSMNLRQISNVQITGGEANATEDFKEEEHPRDGDGQFASKGGGSTKDSKPKGKRIVGVTQYGEEDSKRLGRMFRKFPTDKAFTGSKGHLIADSMSDHWDSQNSYGANIIVGGKVNKAHTKMNSLISEYRKLKTDDNDKPLNYSKGSALLKEMEEYENKAFEELQKLNKNRDLVKDGHWVVSDDLTGDRRHSHLELVKADKKYPKKTMQQGYADSEFNKYDFQLWNNKKMVKVGDTIGVGYDTQILVTSFEYGDDDHDGISIGGIIQDRPSDTFRNAESWELGDDRKGTKIYTQIDNNTRLVKDGGVKMVGESRATEMEEHECDDCGFKSVDYEEYKDHMKSHNKPVGSQGESIATEEEVSDGIWLVDEEEQKELDKEKKRKEQNMNIDEDYMRSMGTVSSDEVDPLKVSDGVANEDNPCWDGYTQYGMKEKDGKQVPNCVKESKATEHDSLCPYCSKQIDDDDHWFEHIEKHRNGESRHHEQIDVKKKWLERCEVCGDIRSSHTNGIDHKFEVDATGTEFIDPEYLEGLGESILFKKNVSVEMVRLETMHEAEKWWDETHAGTHGRKYWNDMNIRERQRTILAYLKAVTGYSGQGMPLVENRASGVRKYALENKRIKFENPDPKFWWNDGEARTGTVLNEYKQSGLEWYSVNSGGQIYNVLKDDAELIASEHLGSEGYVEKDYRNHGAIESDEEAKSLLTDLTELDLLEDLKDNEKTEQAKGEDETEDLDLIEQLMDIEEDEIKEKIEEATPNSLIRYANPKKLPNGKTVMDRIRTSHPQVNEHKLHSPIHISQYHQGDFSVTQICTECGQVIRGDPYSVDEESMQHVRETGHNSFKVEVEEAIDVLANIPFTELTELAWTNLSPILKEKIKQRISKEYWDDGKPTTTGEWWDMNDYEFKWSILKGFGSFAKSDELAKAYWRHLPDHVQNVVKRYRQIHFPDALGIEGMSTNKNHNIDTYLKKSLQDYLEGKNSPNDEYEFGTKEEAKEDSLLKVEEEPEGVDVTVLDEWENKKADENDLEGLIDMYSDTTSIPRNPTYPSEPLGSGANTEECPFCGKLFDEFNLDHHVEEEHGVHTPSQYTQSTIMNNLNDEWLGEAWDKMSAKERRKLLGETKVECSRCGQPLEEDDKKGQDKHAKNRHSEQGQASDNLDIGKVEWVPLGTYKPLYESKATERSSNHNFKGNTAEYFVRYYRPDVGGEDKTTIIGWNYLKDFAQTVGGIEISSVYRNGNALPMTKEDAERLENEAMESKATEGGFGSGKKGHSAWMKDIEWGGNYKQCPICGINTNFTGGKCEICGNSFA